VSIDNVGEILPFGGKNMSINRMISVIKLNTKSDPSMRAKNDDEPSDVPANGLASKQDPLCGTFDGKNLRNKHQ